MPNLQDKVAVVTGASRGCGRGIALALGEAGAIVYVTGRSVRGQLTAGERPETIDDTAEMVAGRGGIGIAAPCNHAVDAEVEALFDRVKQEQGRLDILVNNAWGGNELAIESQPFWETSLEHWQNMFAVGVRSHLTASYFAVPLMLPNRRGLIVNTSFWDRDKYIGHLLYDLAKSTMNRMAFGMARELRTYNIAALALSPGFMRTERVLDHFNAVGRNWQEIDELSGSESTEYVGRAVAALAADTNILQKSGSILRVGELAREYGFTDIDGRQPPAFTIPD